MKKKKERIINLQLKQKLKSLLIGMISGIGVLFIGAMLIGQGKLGKQAADIFVSAAVVISCFVSGMAAYTEKGKGAIPTGALMTVIYGMIFLLGSILNPNKDGNMEIEIRNLIIILVSSMSGAILKLYITSKKT